MKREWRRPGFHRPDEMERYILSQAQRNAYFFLTAALLLWSLHESWQVYVRHTRLNLLPCLLLVGAVLVQSLSQLVLTRRAVREDGDGGAARALAWACGAAVAAAVVAVAAAALLLAVRL